MDEVNRTIETAFNERQKGIVGKMAKHPIDALKFQKEMIVLWNKLCPNCRQKAAANPNELLFCEVCKVTIKPQLEAIEKIRKRLER
jgi:hypothetical protein